MSTFIGQLVGFAIIVAIIVKWVVPPVRKLMNTQQEAVRAALMESKAAADKLANADAEHAKAVEEATSRGEKLTEEARADSSRITEHLREQAGTEAERIKAQGDQQVSLLRQQTIRTAFACLAIFVACLGLFGLASFTTARRGKEFGVRKVLGSSVENIVVLLSKDLLKPVLIATCIAIPAGYYVMRGWLQNFAYQTSLSVWVFLLAALVTFFIALLTVGIKAVNAATANPSESLRAE